MPPSVADFRRRVLIYRPLVNRTGLVLRGAADAKVPALAVRRIARNADRPHRNVRRIAIDVAADDARVLRLRTALDEELDGLLGNERQQHVVGVLDHALVQREGLHVVFAQHRPVPVNETRISPMRHKRGFRPVRRSLLGDSARQHTVGDKTVDGTIEPDPAQRRLRNIEMRTGQELARIQGAHRDAHIVDAAAERGAFVGVYAADADRSLVRNQRPVVGLRTDRPAIAEERHSLRHGINDQRRMVPLAVVRRLRVGDGLCAVPAGRGVVFKNRCGKLPGRRAEAEVELHVRAAAPPDERNVRGGLHRPVEALDREGRPLEIRIAVGRELRVCLGGSATDQRARVRHAVRRNSGRIGRLRRRRGFFDGDWLAARIAHSQKESPTRAVERRIAL